MPDNLPEPEGAPSSPSLDGENPKDSGHLILPPGKTTTESGRVVVTLASLARTPPPIPTGTNQVTAPPKTVPLAPISPRPAIIPVKEPTRPNAAGVTPPRTPQFNRTMEVKLPPKTGMFPKLTMLASMPVTPAGTKAKDENPTAPPAALKPVAVTRKTPPPLPPVISSSADPRNSAAKRLTSMLRGVPAMTEPKAADSIFLDPNEKSPAMIPVARPAPAAPPVTIPAIPAVSPASAEPQTLEAFTLSQEVAEKTPVAEIPSESLLITPPPPAAIVSPPVEKKPIATPPPLPPPILLADSLEAPTLCAAPSLSVAPPTEKMRLPPPVLSETRRSALPPPVTRAPAPTDTPQTLSTPITVGAPIGPEHLARSGAVPPPLSEPPAGELAVPGQPHVGKLAFPSEKLAPPVVSAAAPAEIEKTEVEKAPPLKPDSIPLPIEPLVVEPLLFKPPAESKKVEEPKSTGEPKPPVSDQPREIAALAPSAGVISVAKIFDGKNKPHALVEPRPLSEPPPPKFRTTTLPSTPGGAPPARTPTAASPAPGKSVETRASRARKRRIVEAVAFYIIFAVVLVLLYVLGIQFGRDTRVEGQVIPPTGMTLNNEVWIVSDFRELSKGVADDLAADRAPKLQEIQERQDHVHRAQADIASREERIRLLQEQIQAAKDEISSIVKHARDAAQQVWDGPGAELENEYNSRLNDLQQAIAARAKSLKLDYQPDDTYHSPEVWANAYRLALYQTPPGVDGTKEHQWIEDQITQWRVFTKSVDDRQQKLRAQAAQIQLSPTTRVTDLNDKVEDLQHRVDSTLSEEEPIKAELQQAQADLDQAQAAEAGLDDKYYSQLYKLPDSSIAKRLPLASNGRFTWSHPEKDSAFPEGQKSHSYWLFTRAVRSDGRQYWVLARFSISLDTIQPIVIPPESFLSTKAILRPDLSPDEQQQ